MSRPNKSGYDWSSTTAIRDWARNQRRQWKLELIRLAGGSCIDCGYAGHPAALDFDHIDPATKVKAVALCNTWESAIKEAQKCVLRCANCHRIKTVLEKEDRRLK